MVERPGRACPSPGTTLSQVPPSILQCEAGVSSPGEGAHAPISGSTPGSAGRLVLRDLECSDGIKQSENDLELDKNRLKQGGLASAFIQIFGNLGTIIFSNNN